MENQTLYLSKNKEQILDDKGNIVAVKKEKNGKIFYHETGADTKVKGKVCVGWSSKKVCVSWDDHHVCLGWDDVEFCVKWETEK